MDKRLMFILAFLLNSLALLSQDTIKFVCEEKPIIEILINGKKHNVLVDTGSSLNILCNQVVKQNKMRLRTYYSGNIQSATEKVKARHVDNAEILLGNNSIYQFVMVDISELTDNIFQSTGIKISGILGTPAIKELGMIIDLPGGIVTIKNEPNNLADK